MEDVGYPSQRTLSGATLYKPVPTPPPLTLKVTSPVPPTGRQNTHLVEVDADVGDSTSLGSSRTFNASTPVPPTGKPLGTDIRPLVRPVVIPNPMERMPPKTVVEVSESSGLRGVVPAPTVPLTPPKRPLPVTSPTPEWRPPIAPRPPHTVSTTYGANPTPTSRGFETLEKHPSTDFRSQATKRKSGLLTISKIMNGE